MLVKIYKNLFTAILLMLFLAVSILSCKNKSQAIPSDTPLNGTINISVDESFKPVIDEQIKMYEGSFPGTKINVHYKAEAECIKDILNDSATRLIIVTRGLNPREEKYFDDSLSYIPRWDKLATDAIAIVVNANSTDTIFTLKRLQDQLSGKMGNKQSIVFDGLSATSTVRFAIDSILNGKMFDNNVVKAVKSSQEVLNFVASDVNAIGFVGISWIGNPEDSAQVNMLKKVKIAYVECNRCTDSSFIIPNQLSILTHRYPLVRGLYYILKENYSGLGAGLVDFMQFERGQLIFKRAYLGSAKIGFAVRSININEKLVK